MYTFIIIILTLIPFQMPYESSAFVGNRFRPLNLVNLLAGLATAQLVLLM